MARWLELGSILLLDLLYLLLTFLLTPWILWRIWSGKQRGGWGEKLFGAVPWRKTGGECLWFHAVSVGEVNVLVPLIRQWRQQRPDSEVVVSTTTVSGFELAQQRFPELQVFYCPADFSWAVRNAIRRVQPSAIVLCELELWPNLLTIADRKAVPVAVINGRLSDRSFRGYRRFGWLTRGWFAKLKRVVAQDEVYAQRFCQLGCVTARVVSQGSIKFDGATSPPDREALENLRRAAGLNGDRVVWVAGSTQLEEDLLAVEVLQHLVPRHPQLRLVLVPRHPERVPELERRLRQRRVSYRLRSQLKGDAWLEGAIVLIVDRIGELMEWWSLADLAYVGGSMGAREGQNMIEPAALGVPLSFGPRTRNFRDPVEQLLNAEAAIVVRDADSLGEFVNWVVCEPLAAQSAGQRARKVVQDNQGATARTVVELAKMLDSKGE